MDFLRFIFPRDPTRSWTADPRLPLEIDLDRHALCGVRLGDPLGWLHKLGPAADRGLARKGTLRYSTRGFEVSAPRGTVSSILAVWRDDPAGPFRPFTGILRYHGAPLPLSVVSREPDILSALGDPYWRDVDADEILLFYEFDDVEWQIELTADGAIKRLLLVKPPLFSDNEQRQAYGVTRPWPPAPPEGLDRPGM